MNIENAILRYKDYGKGVKLIDRDATLSKANFINSLIGPRRAGKSSIMLLYMNELRKENKKVIFINGEDIDFEGLTVEGLDKIEIEIRRIYDISSQEKVYLFIDEIQNFPYWSKWVRTLFDENYYNLIISGSTSELSGEQLPIQLRGRSIETLVLPFSFKEYCKAKHINYEKYMNFEDTASILNAFSDFMLYGGYPEVVKSDDTEFKKQILSNIYTMVMQKDLIDKYNIRKKAEFRLFTNSLFASACRNFSIENMLKFLSSKELNISRQAALNYLDYSESVFLIHLIYPYSKKLKVRLTNPRIYPIDQGIMRLFTNDDGKSLEDIAFIELFRRKENVMYYKSNKSDVDFAVVESDEIKELIQVSYSIDEPNAYIRETDSLKNASKETGCTNLKILTFNEESVIKIENLSINVIPVWKWLLS
ncbi:AAA+ superfamily ATPase [Candidatus Mancarchaeum acidiphilum]|uniref:AAA+ superfamily ATPase n=1 Tax=Candidatus Mancarchaeum acidiphilum TaxID=1920749 RepID=A0A218NN74_9ARCH|nr:ATP-binding protein [Candidatus Mancarchaeum acidiphilum]ASI13921.1 AAA+ superfamily ATPase [Candidatus Mancarchaeum acidiphilum]